ncbi:MAG: hypothetical protein QM759_03200 [Terricaulis sp.]
MKTLKSVLLVAVFAALAAPAIAQDTSAQAPAEQVTVTGHAEDLVRDFVGEVSAAPVGPNQLARWDRTICPQIAGIQARYAQFIADRISQRAYQLGLTPGRSGCRANIFIFVTPDSQSFAHALVEHKALMASHTVEENGNSRGQEALADFGDTNRPVRWWHVTQSVASNGQVLGNGEAISGPMAHEIVRLPAGQASRLQPTTRQDFNRVLIILDATQSQGLPFSSIADYLAMVALAQLDPAADTSAYDSILNLFRARSSGAATPTELTNWDLGYLEGLYGAPRFARNSRQQMGSIARHMHGEIDHSGPSQR